MEALAIQLDDQPAVLGVVAVSVASRPVEFAELGLLDRLREPMGMLDVPVMAIFEDRVRAPGGYGDDLVKLMPPAELLTLICRPPQVRLAGELPTDLRYSA
jgi:hypothetical protein